MAGQGEWVDRRRPAHWLVNATVGIALLISCGSPADPTAVPVTSSPMPSGMATASAGPTEGATATAAPTPTLSPTPVASVPADSPDPTATSGPSPTALPSPEPSISAPPDGSPSGLVELIAGGGDADPGDGGPATAALLVRPMGVAAGPDGTIWIADSSAGRVRTVGTDGVITTATDRVFRPSGITVGPGGTVYLADPGDYRIVSIPDDGRVEPVAGRPLRPGFRGDGGPARRAFLFAPADVAVDAAGNVYIADTGNNRIRMVDATTGDIRTIAGDGTEAFGGDGGPAIEAQLQRPNALEVDPDGSLLYIADSRNERLRALDLATGIITTIAGSGGAVAAYDPALTGLQTPLTQLNTMALGAAGNLYVVVLYADLGRTVMRIAPSGEMTRVVGGGASGTAGVPAGEFAVPDVTAISIDPTTGALLIASSDARIYRVADVATPVSP